MSLRDDIKTYLEADATLTGILTGGVHAGVEISRQNTPSAFDSNGEILPCALVKEEADAKTGPFHESSVTYILVFFYQRYDYDSIDQALDRVFTLLHRQKVGTKVWEILWANDIKDQEDQALGCSLSLSRYQVYRNRG
jgi:hypothetical protein